MKTTFYILTASIFLLGACKKKDEVGIQANYAGPKMVAFNNYEGFQQATIPALDSFITIEYEIKLSNTTSTANAPITIKLVKDNNPIFEYNTLNGTSLTPVPVTAYRFDQTDVVIPKGARTAKVRFAVNPIKLLSVNSPTFGLSIYSVSGDGAVVVNDADQTHLVVEILALNAYDGYYQAKGAAYHPTYSNYVFNSQGIFACGAGFALVTSGPNSVDLTPGQPLVNAGTLTYFSAVLPRFTVNPATNKVAITSTNTTVFVQYPTYDSKYDPTAKAFYVKYGWSGDRIATDTFTYCGPR